MLQQRWAMEFVIASGKTHSVREFIEIVAGKLNKKIEWSGEGINEVGKIDGKVIIQVSPKFYRPDNNTLLVGRKDYIEEIGWSRKYDIDSLVQEMLHPPQEKSQVSST